MYYSFETLSHIYESGLLTDPIEGSREIALIPKKGKEGSPFLNNYNMIILKKNLNLLPESLSFLTPFMKVRGTISSSIKNHKTVQLIDGETWRLIWNHVSLLYSYSAHLNVEDPWENSLKAIDDPDTFDIFNLKLFYDNFSVSNDSPLEYFLLNNFRLPEGFVQKALVKKELGLFLGAELNRLFSDYKSMGNHVDEELLEKISLWPSHLSRMSTFEFIEKALENWSKNRKDIDQVRLTTLSILFTLDSYYSRLDMITTFTRAKDLIKLFKRYQNKITHFQKTSVALFYALGKLVKIFEPQKLIRFYPDYLKLTQLCASMYDFLDTTSTLSTDWLGKGASRVDTEYLRIGIDDKGKPDQYALKINAKYLGHISNLPPYLFIRKVKDLLLCNAELMQFTEKHLNVDPVVFYSDLKKAKNEQHYYIQGSQIIEDMVKIYEDSVINSIIKKT
ncbi:hypothetical protein HOB30_05835 [Candidatus Falkowbacteria bacterium]|jgi:hypothetical protein|nr:hypothetical protein [Candidatus Falkowbacteria bacterium]